MARRSGNVGTAGMTGIRALLIAELDRTLTRWAVPGAPPSAYEVALRENAPVVISASRLLKAFLHAGLPADRFGFGGVDYGKEFRLDADELSPYYEVAE
jgi:hypothetical protein